MNLLSIFYQRHKGGEDVTVCMYIAIIVYEIRWKRLTSRQVWTIAQNFMKS